MKPLLRLSVSLWTLLVLSARLESSHADCADRECDSNETETITTITTTTTIRLVSQPNCTLSIGNETYGNGSLTGLIPGAVYQVFINCSNCCKNITTKPEVVRSLTVIHVNTSSVSLNWTESEGNSSFYRVQWRDANVHKTVNVSGTSVTITNLTAGVQYEITITAVADDGHTGGQNVTLFLYTKPEIVWHLNVTEFTTSSLYVMWTEPKGARSFYRVQWTNGTTDRMLNVNETKINVTELTAGVKYSVTVIAVAGDKETRSEIAEIFHYTKPDIIVEPTVSPTTSSISLNWTSPPGEVFMYRLEWHRGGAPMTKYTNRTFAVLSELISGTNYTITVTAIAGDNETEGDPYTFTSFTKPNPVLNVEASPKSTTSIKVKWSYPLGAQSYYKYLIEAYNTAGTFVNKTVSINSTYVFELEPGTQYNISVRTMAAPGSESTREHSFSYTMPKAVTNLTAHDVNKTAIQLTWLQQSDYKPSYSYLVMALHDGIESQNNQTETESFTFLHLSPGGLYTFYVYTVVEGVRSTRENISSSTKPEVVSDIRAIGETNQMSVSWSPAVGQVVSYTVQLFRDDELVQDRSNLSDTTVATVFQGLKPGVLYCVVVVTKSLASESNSSCVYNATFPTPPGSITVESHTESINISWSLPEGMDHNQYNFSVSTVNGSSLTKNKWFLLNNLQSGSPYNISVVTVGIWNYESTAVTAQNYTRPYAVTLLRQTEITTNGVTLVWEQRQSKSHYSYVVQVSNNSLLRSVVVLKRTSTSVGLSSGSKYDFTVTTQTADGTQAAPMTVSYFTRPYSVGGLKIKSFNGTAVHLVWTKPLEYKNEYRYQVQTTGCGSQNQTVTDEEALILGLRPGTKCTFCVVVRAANDTEGEANCTSQYTRPETVQPSVSSHGSNSSILVSWTTPPKKVENYKVYLNGTSSATVEKVLNSSSTSVLFESLSAGMLYSARVITCSGPLNVSSGFVTNATFPNPPGSIEVLTKTTSSIDIRWKESPLMTGASFFYKLTNLTSQEGGSISTTNTIHTFDSLVSGTSYNISIVTVGAMGFESDKVHIYMVTTRPYSIGGLKIKNFNGTAVHLVWTKPLEYKNEYRYQVQTTGCGSQNQTVTDEEALILGLRPGTKCTFCVVVRAADDTEGEANCTSQYTRPETVQPSVSSHGSNSSILVSWTTPPKKVENYKVYLNGTSSATVEKVLNSSSTSVLFESLSAGMLYSARVITCSGPLNVSSGFVTNATFPNPPGSIEVLTKTTSSIDIRWKESPLMTGASFFYKLTNLTSQEGGSISTTNTNHTFDSLVSGTSYNISLVTVGAMGFESDKVHIYMVTTRPYSIGGLKIKSFNGTAVHLVWTKPLEYKNEYRYQVQTTGCGSQNQTVTDEEALILGLRPGTKCTFCVVVRAANDTEGEANCTSQYTRPETVQPSVSSHGSNSSILVSWATPPGKLENYKVYLNGTSSATVEKVLNSTSTSVLFESLSAGRLYSARVITCSGPLNVSSGFVTNATFPNPPGSIEVLTKTTSSIEIRWKESPLMTGASFFYKLTNLTSQEGGSISTTNTIHTFDSLVSGTSYNISIVTVGAMGFESDKVHIDMVTTRPLSVKSVVARMVEENIITVTWEKPAYYKSSYLYNLTWQSRDRPFSIITNKTEYNIDDLDPGTLINFNVATETVDKTQASPTSNSSCTKASPVKNFKCEGPNQPNAEIILSWSKPSGQYSGFQVTVNNNNISTTEICCNHTVPNLRHYTKYNLIVETLSCGQSSTPVQHDCRTGITEPPIPPTYQSLVELTDKAHEKFSLQIDRQLLDDINGQVTHAGVLMTNSPADDTSDLKMYLGKTYKQWREGDTPVYLATVSETNLQSRSGENHLSIEVGDNTKWEGYTNGALDPNGKYQYAIVLFTSLALQNGLVNNQVSLLSITKFYPPVQLPKNSVDIGTAVGVTLGIFFFLFIILIGFIVYWKRCSKKESPDIQIHSMRAKVSMAVRVEDYEAYYKKQKADSNCGFAEEFEDLKIIGTGQSKTSALTLENKPKNRYNNVLPYDSSRVKLSIIHGSPYDDYINANYMPGYNSRKEFIAAQGPLPTTVSEFWRMIWEKNVQTLVMLTRCNEQGRVKCEQYWGPGIKHFENITVTTTSEIPLEDWTIRDFNIKNVKTAETRSVRQFHFTAWPDHGVPETTELLIGFRHLVREHMEQYSRHSPTVVHCSAGVGRTGTFIAIDRLIFQIERDNIVDVYGIVHDLRMHRPLMVQTEDQYVFLNQCAIDIIRSRTGTNVDLIYQNRAALSIYENVEHITGFHKNRYHNA